MKAPSAHCLVRPGTLVARILAGAIAALLASHFAPAATWTGTTSVLWNDSSNWDSLPVSTNSLVFGTAGVDGPRLNNNLTSDSFSIVGITFNSGADAFVIGDGTTAANVGNTFILTGNVTNNSTNLQTLNTPFSMTAVRTFTTSASGGDILLGGNLSGIGGGITKSGLGTLTLSGANSFTGTNTVNTGTLKINAGAGGSLNSGAALTLNAGGTFLYDNTSATGPIVQTMGALTYGVGDRTVKLTHTAAQDVAMIFAGLNAGSNEDGKAINFVVDGTGAVNGTNARISVAIQTAYRITSGNSCYFNGSDFAVYDAGSDGLYTTTLDGFIRSINYGVDANSRTSATGATFASNATTGAGTTYNQEVTGSITAQTTLTLGANSGSGQNNGTLKIVGASDLTMASGATLTLENVNDTGTKGILKTGGGTSTISGGTVIQQQKNGMIRVDGSTDVLNIASTYGLGSSSRFMKSGAGTLIFSGSVGTAFSGFTVWLNAGVMEFGGSTALTASDSIITQDGALFRYNNSSTSSIWSGAISGAGSVAVNNGLITLTADNSYTGPTTISGGTLQLGNGGTTGSLSASSALTNNGALIVNRADTITLAGDIAGAGNLTKTGTGTLVLNGANTLGNVAVNQGLLQLSPSGTKTMQVTTITSSGGKVDFNPGSGVIQTTTGNDANGIIGVWATYGSSDWAVGSPDGISLTNVTAAAYTNTSAALDVPAKYTGKNMNVDSSQSPAGVITPNSLRFNTAAAYTLTLQGANTIASGGILVGTSVGNNLSTITGGTLATGTEWIVNQNNPSNSLEISSGITGGGVVSKWGAGTLVLSGANDYTGQTALYAGTTRFSGAMAAGAVVTISGAAIAQMGTATGLPAGATVTFGPGSTGKLQLNGNNITLGTLATNATVGTPIVENGSADPVTLTVANTADSTFGGKLQNGSTGTLALLKSGTGTLNLSGTANTYTGKTVIDGGTLAFNTEGSLGATPGAAQADHITINNGGTLWEMTGTGNNPLSANRGITLGSGVQTIRHNGNGYVLINGVISGSGGLDIRSDGGNDVRIAGVNTYTGDTRLYSNMGLNNALALQYSTLDYNTAYGGQLNYLTTSSYTAVTFGGLKGNKDLAFGTVALSVGQNNSDTAYSGVLGSTGGSLTKIGSGTLTLGGGNTYTGATNVTLGKLFINGNCTGTGAVTVSGGATLGGTGSIAGNTTIAATGRLAFTLSTVAASHDGFNISGTLTFSGASVLDITANGVLPAPGAYTLVTTTGGITGSAPATVNLPSGWAATASISGDGMSLLLDVTSTGAGTPYSTWATAKGLTGANNGASQDPDNDGRSNLAEFAFNGDPLSGSNNGQVYVLTADGDGDTVKELLLTVAVRKTASFSAGAPATSLPVDGITYHIEGSPTLSGFPTAVTLVTTAVVPAGAPDLTGTDYAYRSFGLAGSNGLPGKGFLRAKVTQP
ncbi:MAG: autotransporter-associated beta strand repeat-containing protein [Verrucomicrobia bacterium]|nr:autotransporter-associated beta strand repeat-containing protein [Verrucomicrobiota bacterium]